MFIQPKKQKMMVYKLIESENQEEFVSLVNKALKEGWCLIDGVSILDGAIRPDIYTLTLIKNNARLN